MAAPADKRIIDKSLRLYDHPSSVIYAINQRPALNSFTFESNQPLFCHFDEKSEEKSVLIEK